jgi:hypothetical protein
MKLSTHSIAQVLLTGLQVANFASAFVPPEYKIYVTGGISVMQTILGLVNHNYNPDGTSASVAYVPPEKK